MRGAWRGCARVGGRGGDSVRPKEMNAGREVTLLHGNNI